MNDHDEGQFEDEGPSRAITMAKKYQSLERHDGWQSKFPRRLNLRPLADLRAVSERSGHIGPQSGLYT